MDLPPDTGAWKYIPEGLTLAAIIVGSKIAPGLATRMLGAELGPVGTATASTIGAGTAGGLQEAANRIAAPGPPPDVKALVQSFGQGSRQGVEGELLAPPMNVAGRVLMAPVRGTARGLTDVFFGPMTDAGKEAYEYLGGKLTAGQARNNPLLTKVDTWLNSGLGGGPYRRQVLEGMNRMRAGANELRRQIGLTADEVPSQEGAGQIIKNAAEAGAAPYDRQVAHATGLANAFDEASGRAYADVTSNRLISRPMSAADRGTFLQGILDRAEDEAERVGREMYTDTFKLSEESGTRVPLNSLFAFAREDIGRRGELGAKLASGPVKSTLKTVVSASPEAAEAKLLGQTDLGLTTEELMATPHFKSLMDALHAAGVTDEQMMKGEVSFEQAHEVRRQLGRMLRLARRTGDRDLERITSNLFSRTDDAMMTAAGKDSPLAAAYQGATANWKGLTQAYREGILAEVADKEPRMVTDYLLQPGREGELETVFTSLGPSSQRMLRSAAVEKLLMDDAGNWVTGKELQKRLLALNKGPQGKTVRILFGDKGAARLDDLARSRMAAADYREAAQTAAGEAGKIRASAPDAISAFASLIKPGNTSAINTARQLIGSDWNQIQARHLDQLLQKPGEMYDLLQKLGKDTVEAIYPDRSLNAGLWQYARVAKQLAENSPGNIVWPLRLQLGTTGTAAALAATGTLRMGTAAKVAGGTLITPFILSKILANPQARANLILTMKQPGTNLASKAAGQLGAFLLREGLMPRKDAGLVGPPPRIEGPGPGATTPTSTGRGGGPGPTGSLQGPPSSRIGG